MFSYIMKLIDSQLNLEFSICSFPWFSIQNQFALSWHIVYFKAHPEKKRFLNYFFHVHVKENFYKCNLYFNICHLLTMNSKFTVL